MLFNLVFAQEEKLLERVPGLKFHTNYTYLRVDFSDDTHFEQENKTTGKDIVTNLNGYQIGVTYFLDEEFGFCAEFGEETMDNDRLSYLMGALGVISVYPVGEKDTYISARLLVGRHFGLDAKGGFLGRVGIGVDFPIIKKISATTEMFITYQNIYGVANNVPDYRVDEIKSAMTGLGAKIGIQLF